MLKSGEYLKKDRCANEEWAYFGVNDRDIAGLRSQGA